MDAESALNLKKKNHWHGVAWRSTCQSINHKHICSCNVACVLPFRKTSCVVCFFCFLFFLLISRNIKSGILRTLKNKSRRGRGRKERKEETSHLIFYLTSYFQGHRGPFDVSSVHPASKWSFGKDSTAASEMDSTTAYISLLV